MQFAKFWIFFIFVLFMIHAFRSVPLFIETYAQHLAAQKNEIWRKAQCNDKIFFNNMRSLNSDFCDTMQWQTERIIQQSSFWVAIQACMPFKDETNMLLHFQLFTQTCFLCNYFKIITGTVCCCLLLMILLLVICQHLKAPHHHDLKTYFQTESKKLLQCWRNLKKHFHPNHSQHIRNNPRISRIYEHEEENFSSYQEYHENNDPSRPIRYRPMYRPPPSPPSIKKRIEN